MSIGTPKYRLDAFGIVVECDTAAEAIELANLVARFREQRRPKGHHHYWVVDRWNYFKACRCGKKRRVTSRLKD